MRTLSKATFVATGFAFSILTSLLGTAQTIDGLHSFATDAPLGATILDISADGLVIAGSANTGLNGHLEPFRWSVTIGFETISGPFSHDIRGISGDGSMLVGSGRETQSSNDAGYYWDEETDINWLNIIPGEHGASDISDDGSTIVGTVVDYQLTPSPASPYPGSIEAYRWNDGIVQGLGKLNGTSDSHARAVSSDGSVIVGFSGPEAFRWTEESGIVGIGDLPGGNFSSRAYDVSGDGSVVVGESHSATGSNVAFRWTENDGIESLGILPGHARSEARGISADSSLIFGSSSHYECTSFFCLEFRDGFIWREDLGMMLVDDFVTEVLNIELAGWHLAGLAAISANERVLVGYGIDPAGVSNSWRLVLPEPPLIGDIDLDGDVDGADFLAWQRNSATPEELSDWEGHYGEREGSLDSVTSVPEPRTMAMILLATSCFLVSYRFIR